MPQRSRPSASRTDKLLEDWGRERPGAHAEVQGVRTRLLQLGTYLSRDNERIARGLGITGPELRVIFALRRSGEPYRMRPTDLLEALLVPSSSMARQLDGLERVRFVKRRSDPEDGRVKMVELTPGGVAAADAALSQALGESEGTQALLALSGKDRQDLDRLLQKLLAQFRAEAPTPP
jgi:DNA-binding MarR family transcriptional regulator